MVRTGDNHLSLVALSGGQQFGLIDVFTRHARKHQARQINAAPAFVVVRRWLGAKGVIHVHRRVDKRGLDEGRRGRADGESLPVILDEDRRSSGNVWSRLAGAALVHVVGRNIRPGIVIVAEGRTQRGDPSSGCDHVWLDTPVFARTAAREIRHRFLALLVDEEVEAVVLRRARRDDVLGHCRTANGLRARPGVARGEFQNVLLIARGLGVRVAHERVELGRAYVVAALRVIAPTVGTNLGSRPHRVVSQHFVRRWRVVFAAAIEQALRDDARARSDAETVAMAGFVRFAGGPVARDDAGHMCAVAVLIHRVGETTVKEECGHASHQIRVHEIGVSRMQTAIRHGNRHAPAVKSIVLRECLVAFRQPFASNQFRSDLINQLHPGPRLDPQDARRLGQLLQSSPRHTPTHHPAEAVMGLLLQLGEHAPETGLLHVRRARCQHQGYIDVADTGHPDGADQSIIKLVVGPVFTQPTNKRKRADGGGIGVIKPGDERVVGNVLYQLNVERLDGQAHRWRQVNVELNQVQARDVLGLSARLWGNRRAERRRVGRRDPLVTQSDELGLGTGAKNNDTPCRQQNDWSSQHQREHYVGTLPK